MKKVIITTCIVIGLLEVMLVIAYFSIFNGAISTDHQDWNTFLQIFNGFVMAILTAVNIYIFYQLTVAIEDKNQKRAVKEKIFEAQSVITQMRVKQYEEVSTAIYNVIAVIIRRKADNGEQESLLKKLAEIDGSLLFKNYHLTDAPILQELSRQIMTGFEILALNNNKDNMESLLNSMTAYLRLMETYIVSQMIIDKDVEAYIRDNNNNIDCTMACVKQVLEEILKELEKIDKES